MTQYFSDTELHDSDYINEHIPGPWKFLKKRTQFSREHYFAIEEDRTYPYEIAVVVNCYKQSKANGLLLSAAPEMLAALKKIESDLTCGNMSVGQLRDTARAAILKATGATP